MKYTSEFDSANGICIVRIAGEYRRSEDSDEMKRFAIDFFTEHGCCLFLFDLTQARIIDGTLTAFYAGNPQGELAKKLRVLKTAAVYRKLTPDDRFFETVAVNRGFQLRAFDALDKAVEWLKAGDEK